MFGKDDELEKVKSALAAMDGDMSAFRVWQKQYDKLNRQWQAVQERYQKARQITEQVHRNAKQLEEILVDDTQGQRKEAARILKEWKRLQNGFDHEFLISKEDREFHSTYDTIVRLGIKAVDKEDQKLILQSEVENRFAGGKSREEAAICLETVLFYIKSRGTGADRTSTGRKTQLHRYYVSAGIPSANHCLARICH